MRQIKWLLTLVIASCATFAHADDACNRECKDSKNPICCDDWQFDFYGDLLYWEVCRGDLDFSSSPTSYVQPEYDFGFRIGGFLVCDCWDLHIRYTHLDTSESSAGGTSTTRRYELDMNMVDTEVGFSFIVESCDSEGKLRPFVGVRAIRSEHIYHNHDSSGTRVEQCYGGAGPYVGMDVNWPLWEVPLCDCSMPTFFVVRGAWGIINSSTKVNDTDNDRESVCLFNPFFELFAGVNFDFNLCDMCCLDVTVGWEIQSIMGMRRITDNDDNTDFGMSGLTARFGMQF